MNAASAVDSAVVRGKGFTKSEQYLRSLCDDTFLSLWSYANVFRGLGKELCDLLVVCDEDVIVFSDKYCEFPNTGSPHIDWNRWFKRAIAQSAKQAWGAERWLRRNRNQVYLDATCTTPFPFEIPPPERARYHLVVVAHGCAQRCAALYSGRYSLPIDSWVIGRIHYIPDDVPIRFVIGDINPTKSFVHVLTEQSLGILLRTRDTITDFVSYLRKKEAYLRDPRRVVAAGEEELLSVYLRHMNERREHDFVTTAVGIGARIPSGLWDEFKSSRHRTRQLRANEVSYVWDTIIERFAQHALNGTQYYSTVPGVDNTERIVRFMAKEDRTARRLLANAFVGILDAAESQGVAIRYMVHGSDYAKYVFLALEKPVNSSEDEYRRYRHTMLEVCCGVLKLECPSADHIVGIATEPGLHLTNRSEDAIYLDARNWKAEDFSAAQRDADRFGLGKNLRMFTANEQEYP